MPDTTTGIVTAYDLTEGVIVNMDDAIFLLSPEDTPLLTGFTTDGFNAQSLSVLGSEPVDQIEYAWQDDTNLTPRSTLASNATAGEGVITVASGDRTKFSTGDTLRIEAAGATEALYVTGYGSTADTLTVTRNYDSLGTATSYATSAIVIGVGTALAEGSDPEKARAVDRTKNTNVTQIFGPTAVELSGTQQVVPRYGVPSEWTHQMLKRVRENAIAREQAFVYGIKSNDTSAKKRLTGGLTHYISTNIDSTSTTLTVSNISTQQQSCYNNGGVPGIVMANPVAFGDLNSVADTNIVRTELENSRRGRFRVEQVYTEFGPSTMVRNRWMLPQDAIGWSRDQVKRRIMRPLVMQRLAKTGDSDKAQIVCEEGLQVAGEEHAFRFSNLGYSGSN